MPTGPRGERRPADVIGAAVMVAKLAPDEIVEDFNRKSGRARSGAKVRAEHLSSPRRSEITRKAATTRWAGDRNG
jgi:hypothetical protein